MKHKESHTLFLILFFLLSYISEPCSAHPHVFVTVNTTVIIEKDKIVALKYDWTFDDDYASTALEGLDKNNDGRYDKTELQNLADTNLEGLKEFNYFTTATQGQKKISFSKPKVYNLEYSNKILKLHFILPFAVPLPLPITNMKFFVEDPSIFIAFNYSKENAFRFSEEAPKTCKSEPLQKATNQGEVLLQRAFSSQFNSNNEEDTSSEGFQITCK